MMSVERPSDESSQDLAACLPSGFSVECRLGTMNPNTRPMEPYSALPVDLLSDFSDALSASSRAGAYPDLLKLAHWCRRRNLLRMQSAVLDQKSRLGRGLVFHLAPPDVPTQFMYSFAFGLLAGNANLVRLPAHHFPQVELVCEHLEALFALPKYAALARMTTFLRYESGESLTEYFSKYCDARLVWGGDDTVRRVRQHPLKPRAVELAFGDRQSLCVMDAGAVERASNAECARLASNFFDDAFVMDSRANASLRVIIWLGEHTAAGRARFWSALEEIVNERYPAGGAAAAAKFQRLCAEALGQDGVAGVERQGHQIYRSELSRLPEHLGSLPGAFGHFYEFSTEDLGRVAPAIDESHQTLTYFGIDRDTVADFVLERGLPGIDRIVPVGRALDMDVVWDGHDVIGTLSRIVGF